MTKYTIEELQSKYEPEAAMDIDAELNDGLRLEIAELKAVIEGWKSKNWVNRDDVIEIALKQCEELAKPYVEENTKLKADNKILVEAEHFLYEKLLTVSLDRFDNRKIRYIFINNALKQAKEALKQTGN